MHDIYSVDITPSLKESVIWPQYGIGSMVYSSMAAGISEFPNITPQCTKKTTKNVFQAPGQVRFSLRMQLKKRSAFVDVS